MDVKSFYFYFFSLLSLFLPFYPFFYFIPVFNPIKWFIFNIVEYTIILQIKVFKPRPKGSPVPFLFSS